MYNKKKTFTCRWSEKRVQRTHYESVDGYKNENVLDILTNLSTKKLTLNFEVKYYAGGRYKNVIYRKP